MPVCPRSTSWSGQRWFVDECLLKLDLELERTRKVAKAKLLGRKHLSWIQLCGRSCPPGCGKLRERLSPGRVTMWVNTGFLKWQQVSLSRIVHQQQLAWNHSHLPHNLAGIKWTRGCFGPVPPLSNWLIHLFCLWRLYRRVLQQVNRKRGIKN